MEEFWHDKIIDKCVGCSHVAGDICRVYPDPPAKWRNHSRGINCPMCTTVVRGKDTSKQGKQRIGQQKGKKKK